MRRGEVGGGRLVGGDDRLWLLASVQRQLQPLVSDEVHHILPIVSTRDLASLNTWLWWMGGRVWETSPNQEVAPDVCDIPCARVRGRARGVVISPPTMKDTNVIAGSR